MKPRILELASKGLTDEQIAERLGCTPRHVAKVRQEAGLLHKREASARHSARQAIQARDRWEVAS